MTTSIRLPDDVLAAMHQLAGEHDRTLNSEFIQACRAWVEQGGKRSMSRPAIISIGLRPDEVESALKPLLDLFSYVGSYPQEAEVQVLCAGPKHGLSYDEAFILCQKKFFEVGWVYADMVKQ